MDKVLRKDVAHTDNRVFKNKCTAHVSGWKKITILNQVSQDSPFLFRCIYYWIRLRTKGLDDEVRDKGRTTNLESHSKHFLVFPFSFVFPGPKFFPTTPWSQVV